MKKYSFLFLIFSTLFFGGCTKYEESQDTVNMRNIAGDWELQNIDIYSYAENNNGSISYVDNIIPPAAAISFLIEGIYNIPNDPFYAGMDPFYFSVNAVNFGEMDQIQGTWEYVPSTYDLPIMHFDRSVVETDNYVFVETVSEDELVIILYAYEGLQDLYFGLSSMAEYFSLVNWYDIATVSTSFDDGYYLGYQLGLFDSITELEEFYGYPTDEEVWDKYFVGNYGESYSFEFWSYYDDTQMAPDLLSGFWSGYDDGYLQGESDYETLRTAYTSEVQITYYLSKK